MPDRSALLRGFFAHYVARRGGARDPRIEAAFAAVPREEFTGPGPWSVFVGGPWAQGGGYIQTPDDDLAFLYQDTLIALDASRSINIGEPSLHAHCLDILAPQAGETVLQIGAGVGYYTALLAHLVGENGQVHAYEIDPDLAHRAERNLASYSQVTLHARSGIADGLPKANAIYVNAGIAQPSWAWLDALYPGGRLLFPLQAPEEFGGMLLVTRPKDGRPAWPAHFVARAGFIYCQAPHDHEVEQSLSAAFKGGGWDVVKSLRLIGKPDASCWFKGEGWWLSTELS